MTRYRHDFGHVCHEYTPLELQFVVLVARFGNGRLGFVLLFLGLVRLYLLAAQEDALEEIDLVL